MLTQLKTFLNEEDGATPIEFGLLLALISIAVIDTLTATGNSASSALSGLVSGEAK